MFHLYHRKCLVCPSCFYLYCCIHSGVKFSQVALLLSFPCRKVVSVYVAQNTFLHVFLLSNMSSFIYLVLLSPNIKISVFIVLLLGSLFSCKFSFVSLSTTSCTLLYSFFSFNSCISFSSDNNLFFNSLSPSIICIFGNSFINFSVLFLNVVVEFFRLVHLMIQSSFQWIHLLVRLTFLVFSSFPLPFFYFSFVSCYFLFVH